MNKQDFYIEDTKQNFWQLASISGTALGIPGMLVGGYMAQQYGNGTALISIIVGNFILWVIGLGIISMVDNRKNALENIRDYLGRMTGNFAAIIFVSAFLLWYSLQVKGVSSEIHQVFPLQHNWVSGMVLGVMVAILGMGGIRLIKRICVFALPLLLAYGLYVMIRSVSSVSFAGTWSFSLPAIIIIVLTWLSGTINMPTFFRHSRSKADSILGLSLVTFFHMFFQFIAIILVGENASVLNQSAVSFQYLGIVFFLLTFVCGNVLNIYYASAGWEIAFPLHKNPTVYLLIGIIGTAIYMMFEVLVPIKELELLIEFLEIGIVSSISCMGIVLLISLLNRIVVQHRPRTFEKIWSSISWLLGVVAAIIALVVNPSLKFEAIQIGVIVSVFSFLVIIFLEETFFSIKHIWFRS